MNFKEKLTKVLQKLNLMDKAKKGTLTHEEWQTIVNSYQEEFKVTLQDDLEAEQASHVQPVMTQEQMDRIQGILDGIVNPQATNQGNSNSVATAESIIQLAQSVDSLVNQMANHAQEDVPTQVLTASTVTYTGNADRARFLFGIDSPMFSMDKRWNKIAANPAAAASFGSWDEDTEGADFRRQTVTFSRSLQQRYMYLHANNMLDVKRLAAGANRHRNGQTLSWNS